MVWFEDFLMSLEAFTCTAKFNCDFFSESFDKRAVEMMRCPCGIGHNNNAHRNCVRAGKVYPYGMSRTKYAAKTFKVGFFNGLASLLSRTFLYANNKSIAFRRRKQMTKIVAPVFQAIRLMFTKRALLK